MESYVKPKIDDDFRSCKDRKTQKQKEKLQKYQANREFYDEEDYEIKPKSQDAPTKTSTLTKTDSPTKTTAQPKIDFPSKTESGSNLTAFEAQGKKQMAADFPELDDKETHIDQLKYGSSKRGGMMQEYSDMMITFHQMIEDALKNREVREDQVDDILKICEEGLCQSVMGNDLEDRMLDFPDDDEGEEAFETTDLEVDELTRDTQQFILDRIQREQKAMKFDNSDKMFPSLESTNTKTTKAAYTKQVTDLSDEKKNAAPSIVYKNPENTNQWQNDSAKNLLFQVSKRGSAKEVTKLAKSFPDLELGFIKMVYLLFNEDFETTKEYLRDRFKDSYQHIGTDLKQGKKSSFKAKAFRSSKANISQLNYGVEVEQLLKEMSFNEIRTQIAHHRRVRAILDRSANQARSSKTRTGASELESFSRDETNRIKLLTKASKVYILKKYRENNNLYGMDLHGLFWDEAKDIVNEQIAYIKSNVPKDRDAFRFNEKTIDGHPHLKYEIITGKGLNSREGYSVLFKNLCEEFERANYHYTPLKSEGRIYIYLPL